MVAVCSTSVTFAALALPSLSLDPPGGRVKETTFDVCRYQCPLGESGSQARRGRSWRSRELRCETTYPPRPLLRPTLPQAGG